MAETLDGNGFGLDKIHGHTGGLDILISCTGSDSTIVDQELYQKLTAADVGKKVVVDLAIPSDIDRNALNGNVEYIGIEDLKDEARKNLELRQKELEKCKQIIRESIFEFEHVLREREIELAMRDVPQQVKQIKEKALTEVFAKEMENMDDESKEVLEKVIQYMEKKYISGPMKLAEGDHEERMSRKINIGSRGSDLALWQANHVKAQLEKLGHEVEIKVIKTQGDKVQNLSFDKLEGKGFFTKELEEALLAESVDLAVHSHKDLPTEHPEGLVVAAVSEREDPADILLINRESVDFDQVEPDEGCRCGHKFSQKKGAVTASPARYRVKRPEEMFQPEFRNLRTKATMRSC